MSPYSGLPQRASGLGDIDHELARFNDEETKDAAFETFRRYVAEYGLPQSLYVDRDSIYVTTRSATVEEELAAQAPLTQFGRAMSELGVGIILAHSPQAKGRVERRNGILQDRLMKALRREGISEMAPANGSLKANTCQRSIVSSAFHSARPLTCTVPCRSVSP